MNVFGHRVHTKFRSWLWIIICWVRWPFCMERSPSLRLFFLNVHIFCHLKKHAWKKDLSQMAHLCGRSPVCDMPCFLSSWRVLNSLPHSSEVPKTFLFLYLFSFNFDKFYLTWILLFFIFKKLQIRLVNYYNKKIKPRTTTVCLQAVEAVALVGGQVTFALKRLEAAGALVMYPLRLLLLSCVAQHLACTAGVILLRLFAGSLLLGRLYLLIIIITIVRLPRQRRRETV